MIMMIQNSAVVPWQLARFSAVAQQFAEESRWFWQGSGRFFITLMLFAGVSNAAWTVVEVGWNHISDKRLAVDHRCGVTGRVSRAAIPGTALPRIL
jgi:hypothetical protein